jgi:hypothetical protein
VVTISIRWCASGVLTLAAIACWLTPISAHEVVVEQMVNMRMADRGGELLVELQIPATAAGDLRLPALLKGNDPAALQQQLKIVTADIAHNLDVRQNDVTLADPTITVRPGATGVSIEAELHYATRPGTGRFSARLNAFSSKDGPVRTVARYQPESGGDQIVSVTGPAARVMFDPPLGAVLGQFAIRGLRTLFDGGDHLLFLACLLLPIRRARSLFALIAAVMLGQAVAAVVSVTRPPISADWVAGAGMVTASAIVIGSVQGVVRARLRWTIPVALTFGVLNGYLLGQTAASTAQFGGGHSHAATFTFGAVILIGELWLGALVWTFRGWLDERGLPEPVVAIIGLVLVAHQAVHRIVERADLVGQGASLEGQQVLIRLTLAWIGVILFAAASNAVAGGHVPSEPGLKRVEG